MRSLMPLIASRTDLYTKKAKRVCSRKICSEINALRNFHRPFDNCFFILILLLRAYIWRISCIPIELNSFDDSFHAWPLGRGTYIPSGRLVFERLVALQRLKTDIHLKGEARKMGGGDFCGRLGGILWLRGL